MFRTVVLSLLLSLMTILFTLLYGEDIRLTGRGIPVADFFVTPWDAMLAYNRLEVREEFLITIICSSINVSQHIDTSAVF